MKVIVPIQHLRTESRIIGVYTDINRAKRAVCQADYDPVVFNFREFELNDGLPSTFESIELEYITNAKE